MERINNPLFTQTHTRVYVDEREKNGVPASFVVYDSEGGPLCTIEFQFGPTKKEGVNGIFNEDLLLMVIERLKAFQKTEYSCRENACALTHLEEAVMWLRKRTDEREARGVLGTSEV